MTNEKPATALMYIDIDGGCGFTRCTYGAHLILQCMVPPQCVLGDTEYKIKYIETV